MKHERAFPAVMDQDRKVHMTEEDRRDFVRYAARVFGAGEELELVIRKRKRSRSSQSNRYYWGVVIAVAAEELGYADPDELHEALVWKFGPPQEPDALTGAPRRARTSQMSTEEFSDYVSKVITWLEADMQIRVPRPHEQEQIPA